MLELFTRLIVAIETLAACAVKFVDSGAGSTSAPAAPAPAAAGAPAGAGKATKGTTAPKGTPAPATGVAPGTVDIEKIRAKLTKVSESGRKDEALALLKEFGAQRLSLVDPAKLPAFETRLDELLATPSEPDPFA